MTEYEIDYIRVVLGVSFVASAEVKNIAVDVFKKLVDEADLAGFAEFEESEFKGDGGSWSGYVFEAEIAMAGENVPLDYASFREALRKDMETTLAQWAEGYHSYKIEVGEYEVDSFNGFCEGFLGDYEFEEAVENKGIDWLIGSYIDLLSGEIYEAYLEWFEQNA